MDDRFEELYNWKLKPVVMALGQQETLHATGSDEYDIYAHINASVALTIGLMDVVKELARDDAPAEGRAARSITAVQQTIGNWSRRTFPNSTSDSTMRHLWKEIAELDAAIDRNKNEEVCEEVADVFILLVQLCALRQISLEVSVMDKHEENMGREWDEPDEHSVVYHTKDSDR